MATTFENRGALKQHGQLGLGYGSGATADTTNILRALRINKIIDREEFSYYISNTATFLTFGSRDNYLARHGFSEYFFAGDKTYWYLTIKSFKTHKVEEFSFK